ncbi:hypothetical protein PILCRDRAFT_817654 [Piloderma croceum F 1598]|uniref:DH domain-containing protein n=1 Tax=Piloderma croceum (strain F 1598) TaxID=765440 RepID=A0A0C3BEW4_PILCF|nr:hypothetical protein PILCRDRAFT_817654 [Piloderma croceum F 1598]
MHNNRPHPYVYTGPISPDERPPFGPSPVHAYTPYAFEVDPSGGYHMANPWDNDTTEPNTAHPSHFSNSSDLDMPARPRSRTRSVFEQPTEYLAFPEPQLYRSSSQRVTSTVHHPLHRNSKSDTGPLSPGDTSLDLPLSSPARAASPASSYYPNDEFSRSNVSLSQQLSIVNLDPETKLRLFQAGDLPDSDDEWHKLVPSEAQEALGDREVQRQSVLFEVFKSERDYVHDMELIEEVFINPLKDASPPVISHDRLPGFMSEVFWNLHDILTHHQRMLGSLFARQREQHPLVQSVADIVLDTSLLWRNEYESYIKHYPLAEARHRAELKRNSNYQTFIQKCSQDPRIRKRDLITFLSRPVTRLPRLSLVLEHINKLTDAEHPDSETLPLILTILSDFIKSTQPGIAAAEDKVKFWNLCESLVYQKGEIIDMNVYEESRTLVYSGSLTRRQRSETDWHGWNDYFVALLDNFLLLTREETRHNGVVQRHVVSRPLPLEYLRIGSFNEPPETRKVGADDGRLLESLRFRMKPLYPFTIYHASAKSTRRYTLYAASESARTKWKDALEDTIAVYKARQESNMWFVPQSLNDGFFRTMGTQANYNSGARFSGKVTSAVPFSSGGKRFLAAGCSTGIFVTLRGDSRFRRVLTFSNPPTLIALQDFNRLVVLHEASLLAYSLDLLARVAQGQAPPQTLDASMEKLAGQDGSVLFARSGRVGNHTLLIFASKKLLQVTVHILEAINLSNNMSPRRSSGNSLSFRPFGGPFYIPKDAYDVTPLVKTIAVSTEKGIIILDPTNLHKSVVTVVPDLSSASTNPPTADLKSRCDAARPLGLVRCDADELLVVYDTLGCYITKHGVPSRSSGYIRWETQANQFAHRGSHILLFSAEFIEIRNINTGRIVQVIEGRDLRLLHSGPSGDTILIAMRGQKDDRDGVSDKITEMVETAELVRTPSTARAVPENLWDEWNM